MEAAIYKDITAKEFKELDFNSVTLVDLREPDEVIQTFVSPSRPLISLIKASIAERLCL